MTMAEYLKSVRTSTQADVDRVAREHSNDHVTVSERKEGSNS